MRTKTIPVILVDNRENLFYKFSDFNVKIAFTTLKTGDYSVGIQKGDETIFYDNEIAIERKTLDNFTGDLTLNRDRFEESVKRGSGLRFYAVYIEGEEAEVLAHKYESQILPQSVLNTKLGWSIKYRVPIEFCGNRLSAEAWTYHSLMLFLEYKKKGVI